MNIYWNIYIWRFKWILLKWMDNQKIKSAYMMDEMMEETILNITWLQSLHKQT
jgi:hypothetical protein